MHSAGISFSLILLSVLARGASAAGAVQERELPPHELMELRVDDGKPVLYTAQPANAPDSTRQLKVAGFSGAAELTVAKPTPADKNATAPQAVTFYRLLLRKEDQAGQREAWQITWSNGTLDVQKSIHFTGEFRYTRLTRLLASTKGDVQLMVTEAGRVPPGQAALKIYARAADMHTLLRQHRESADAHLRPVMRALGQEAVFAPEPRVAWQVFAEEWVPSEALQREVDALLPGLDVDKAADREAATEKLKALGSEASLVIMQVNRATLSAEQNARLDVVLAASAPLPRAEADALRGDVPFLLDCLYGDDVRLRAAALNRLKQVTGKPIEFDLKLEGGARAAAVRALREKLIPAQ